MVPLKLAKVSYEGQGQSYTDKDESPSLETASKPRKKKYIYTHEDARGQPYPVIALPHPPGLGDPVQGQGES